LCAKGIDCTSFYNFSICFSNCSESVVCLIFNITICVKTFTYIVLALIWFD
jgi:hypothetical protein